MTVEIYPRPSQTKSPWAVVCLALVALGLCWSSNLSAHGTDHSSLKITRQQQSSWTFELQAPLAVLDNALRASNEQHDWDNNTSSTKYKESLVDYVKKGFGVWVISSEADNQTVDRPTLGRGRIKLDDHVSVFQFEIRNLPDTAALSISLPYMQHDPHQQNLLQLIDGDRRERIVLNAENAFTLERTEFFAQ